MTVTCPYFLAEVMVKFTRKAKRHFVMVIKCSMYQIECNSGHNSRLVPIRIFLIY